MMAFFIILFHELLVFLHVDQCCSLQRDDVKHILTIILNNFDFLDKLINIDAIFFDTWSMRVHNLLAYIAFGILGHILLGWIGSIVIASGHVLHFHVICNWLLTVNLTNQRLHTFLQTLRDLRWHFRYHVDYLFLPLFCLHVCFYQIEVIVVTHHLLSDLRLRHIKLLLSLHLLVIHI